MNEWSIGEICKNIIVCHNESGYLTDFDMHEDCDIKIIVDTLNILEKRINALHNEYDIEIDKLKKENDSLRAQNQMMEKIISQNLSDRSNGGWHTAPPLKIKEDPYNYNKEEKTFLPEQINQDKKKTCLNCCMYKFCKKCGQVSMNMIHTSSGERFIGKCDRWSDNILDWAKKGKKDGSQVDIQTDEYGFVAISRKGPIPEKRI